MRYLGLLLVLVLVFATPAANAQDSAIFTQGEAVVTGFSGTKPADPPAAAGVPLDEIFIDIDGASAQILRLEPGSPPAGQLVAAPPVLGVKARDIGQVFAIGLDDGLLSDTANAPPNIYLGATSAFGLQIVVPDSDGDGRPERVKKGQPDAQWMAGQFGLDKGGEPGSIYKIDGKTGAVSLFATIPGNSGPGLGDVVFDRATRQFFVSDLDTGLIHRLDEAGKLIDTFDHGQTGRPAAGLPAVADDGVVMDIKAPTFDSENSSTWGFTQPERRVWGLGLRAGRLYYAPFAGPEIWSVAINLDGTFGGDPRREIEVSGTPNNHPISDIAFDAQDHMYVAQRGGIKGSYDYSVFADSKQSVIFRFTREIPDDPVTPGIWVPIPDEYAVGFPPDHRNATGGVALGYGYDEAGVIRPGACDMTVWMSGDSLLDNPVTHGLQGNDRALTRPDNEPPAKSYFVDYDGRAGDPRQQGHVGDVEIWQPCDQRADADTYTPADELPPGFVPPVYVPPGYVPPEGFEPDEPPPVGTPDYAYNLRLKKKALSDACAAGGLGFLCDYVVRVTNEGPDTYFGPIVVNDKLPANPAGAMMTVTNAPPWFCMAISPSEQQCTYAVAALHPGESIDLLVTVDLPVAAPVCHLDNLAGLVWQPGLGDIDPTDDFDLATATIPADHCPPPAGETTNLKIWKNPLAELCTDKGLFFECKYLIVVRNIGAGIYNGPIKVEDTIAAGASASFSPVSWNCAGPAPTYTCERGPVVLLPNQAVNLNAVVKVPKNLAGPLSCKAENKAKIVEAAGGSDQNTDATDDEADATMTLPGELAQCPGLDALSNLRLKKTGPDGKCPVIGNNWECIFKITVKNIGAPYTSPIQFLDALPFGSPANSTISFQAPAGWNCGGPVLFPTLYQCSSNNPNLAHLGKAEITATVKIPVAPLAKCEVTNNAVITKAPGGTLLNSIPGDDDDSAKAQLQFVQPPDGPGICATTNLKIEKTRAKGIECPVNNGDWLCDFDVKLTNTGDDPYTSEVQFIDALPFDTPAGATVTFNAPASWQCGGPLLFPTLYQCRSDNPDLAKGESVVIQARVRVPVKAVEQCYIVNKAQIVKAPGGSPLNKKASDDKSWAAMKFQKDVPLPIGQVACPSPKHSMLKIEKSSWVPGNKFCAVSGNIWICEWLVKLTNLGDTHTSPIAIFDTLSGVQPAGASIMLSQPTGWSCKQLGWDGAACRNEKPNLKKGESVEFAATVRVPIGPVGTCTVANQVRITSLNGSPNLNPDKANHVSMSSLTLFPYIPPNYPNAPSICVSADVGEPEPPLTTPEGKESNLTITKTASASQVTATGQNTKFIITVTNEGPGVFNAPIEIQDTLFDGVTVEPSNGSWSNPWMCEGQSNIGHPERGICKHPEVELDPGESVMLDLEIEAPNSFVAPSGSQVRCGYNNKVEILRPAGGSPKNNNAADDTAFAEVKFAPFELHGKKFCELGLTTPPDETETNLTITKTAGACAVTPTGGQNCPFAITVTNAGGEVHNGPIEIQDTLFDGAIVEPSNGSWSDPWVCEGQSNVGHPERGICTHPPIELDPGESVVLNMEIEAPSSFVAPSGSQVRCGYQNKAEILEPAGGTTNNTNAGDDTAVADVKFAPFEKHGTTFCGLGLTTPPASQTCPQGWSRTPVPGKCCPPNSGWDGERCKRDVKAPEEVCPKGYTGTPPNCREIKVPERCTGGMERIDGECRCPRGARFLDGKCRTPTSQPETCGPNEVGTYPNCRCARGFTGEPPNCKARTCPPGTTGKYPNCREIDCPANQQWIDGACRCAYPLKWNGKRCVADTPKACPADSVGDYPNCRCKRGTTGVPGNCKRIVVPKTCPADSLGDYPNCRCKRGTAGVPGNCKRVVVPEKKCPEGFRGTPPNCKRIVPPRRICPEGFRGTPPNCKRIVEPRKECPPGFRGVPPNCKRVIPPRRLCPQGFRGVPPNCKRIGTNPL